MTITGPDARSAAPGHAAAAPAHREACRRGGALAPRPQDLDPEQCLILLREKGETVRWQPVSPTLMAALLGHAAERHAPPDGQLLRYRNGRRITYRRYDHLWDRLGRYLPWVRAQQISMHWIRHIVPDVGQGRGIASDATFRLWREDGPAGPADSVPPRRRPIRNEKVQVKGANEDDVAADDTMRHLVLLHRMTA